jgi:hypothetical protein
MFFLLPGKLSSQSDVNSCALEIKKAIYNQFPGFVDKIMNERGDYELFMNVFEEGSSTILNDNLFPDNLDYSKAISATEYQQMLAVRNFDIEDFDWGGMPLFIGEPSVYAGDSTGEVEIVVKHIIKNNTPSYTFLKDTQLIIITFSFNKKVLRNEEGKMFNDYRFKIKNAKLHTLYHKPNFVRVQQINQIISFGKNKGNQTIVDLDSFRILERTFTKSDSFYRMIAKNNENDNLNGHQLIVYKDNKTRVYDDVQIENQLVQTLMVKQNVKIGEVSYNLFSNFGSNWFNLAKISGSQFDGERATVTAGGGSLGFGFPLIRKTPKQVDVSFSNIPYLLVGFGYSFDNTFVGLNNITESERRTDIYGNSYTRIANYHSFSDRQKTRNGLFSFGFENRKNFWLRDDFFNWGLSALVHYNISNEYSGSACNVTYSGLYSSYFNIALSDNGIMDYGSYSFVNNSATTKSRGFGCGLRPHVGIAFELSDKIVVNTKSFLFMPLNFSKKEIGYNNTLGVDFNRFKSLNEIGASVNKKIIGFELSLLMHL